MSKICILLLTLVVAAIAQTSADLSAKYPQITAYRVRPDAQMTARFSGDGQVCEMTLEKRAETSCGIILGAFFPEKEVQSLVDDVVREDLRGRNLAKAASTGSSKVCHPQPNTPTRMCLYVCMEHGAMRLAKKS